MTGSLRKTEEALAAGVPAACADANGHTPLHQCAFMGFEAVAGALLAADAACVHARNLMHNTPLHTAAFQGYAGIVGLLLDAGADVNATGTAGNTPLHLASLEGNLEVMEVLLGAGADPNATCSNRNTPLHVVATAGIDDPLPVARLLLRHGAAPEAPNRFGKTPLDLAHFQAQRPLARIRSRRARARVQWARARRARRRRRPRRRRVVGTAAATLPCSHCIVAAPAAIAAGSCRCVDIACSSTTFGRTDRGGAPPRRRT